MSTAPFAIRQLDHIVLRTADLPRLVSFYLALGCSVERDVTERLGMMQMRLGASMLDIVDVHGALGGEVAGPPTQRGRNLDHFAVRVEPYDEQAILDFCDAAGIEATVPPFELLGAEGVGPAVYIQDPDGNRVELKGPVSVA